ncbi:deoxynucleotidyltransferase terminal-interacting protein 2 [Engraulis encrasicolus]|uniref:deoxynucleotidyltransferase terminal-interacting protein 2 n=1 Tax=Engraulis encrasicolus TaxID=184585 RepID=UPI002FD766CD
MVATRRGVRVVESPTKTVQNEPSSSSDEVISTRRSRRGTVRVEAATPPAESASDAQEDVTSTASAQEDKPTEEATACVEDQPEDIHDADVSDLESCYSAASPSAVQTPSTKPTRRRGRPPGSTKKPKAGTEGLSEAESCASAVSATPSTASRRSTRNPRKKDPEGAEEAAGSNDQVSEAESCSSVASLRRRALTRSQKKATSHTEDTDLSEHDTYDLRKSTVRKSTRGRKPSQPVEPVPIDLDDSEDVSSASSATRKTPGRRGRTTATVTVSSAAPAPSTDDNASGLSTRRSSRRKVKDAAVRGASDSESDFTGYSSLGSPASSVQGKGTPCSSRTGSAGSNRAAPVSRATRSLRSGVTVVLTPSREDGEAEEGGEDAPAVETEEKMEVQEPEKTVIVTGGDEEMAEGDDDNVPPSAVTEAEEMEVKESEKTVVVTREEEESSVLADKTLVEDKTLIEEEEEEETKEDDDAAIRGVTVVDPAQPEFQEGTRTDSPIPTVTVSESPDTVEAAEMIPAVDGDSETDASKGSVTVSGGQEEIPVPVEIPESSTGDTTTLETPCTGSVTVHEVAEADTTETVGEVAEADTTETVGEDHEKPYIVVDLGTDETVTMTISEPSDCIPQLDDDVAETAEPHVASEEPGQTVKVTVCAPESEPTEEVTDDGSAGPDTSCLKTVSEEDTHQDDEDQPMETCASDPTEVSEDPVEAPSSSSIDPELSAQDADQPTGSRALPKAPVVSLLDSSDEEDEDSDACSFAEGGLRASENEGDSEEVSDSEEAPTEKIKRKALPTDGLFVIDTQPGVHSSQQYYSEERAERVKGQDGDEGEVLGKGEDEEEFVDEELDEDEDEDSEVLFSTRRNKAANELSCRIDPGLKVKELGGLYINFDGSKSNKASSGLKKLKEQKHLDELMKKSVIVPDLEKQDCIAPYKESMNALKLKRRVERQKTTGDGWYNMKAPEMTEELKNDLKALKMRSAMDPKRFYKKDDREGFAKYVQVGTVVDSPLDFYHSRIPQKERKRTIVEELLADAEFRSNNKRKYQEIMTERAALVAGKRHKKNKFKSK